MLIVAATFYGRANAQTTINSFPDTSQTTTFTAEVVEQIRVTVPSGVTFDVTTTNSATNETASVTIDSMAFEGTNHLRVSMAPYASSFTAPSGSGSTTWWSGDVSWAATGWTNGTGSSGTMSSLVGKYVAMVNCDAGANTCTNSSLSFTLAAKNTVDVAGNHTLAASWKFESVE